MMSFAGLYFISQVDNKFFWRMEQTQVSPVGIEVPPRLVPWSFPISCLPQ